MGMVSPEPPPSSEPPGPPYGCAHESNGLFGGPWMFHYIAGAHVLLGEDAAQAPALRSALEPMAT